MSPRIMSTKGNLMTFGSHSALLACLAIVPLVAACSTDRQPTPPADESAAPAARTTLGRTIETALDEARKEMATGNVSIGGGMNIHIGGTTISDKQPRDADGNPLPKAEISPTGELSIGGKPIAVTPEQQALLLAYRGHVVSLVETGMQLGIKGADLGMEAAGEAIKNLFTGGGADFEQRIEAQAAKIESEALKLCDSLPAMLDTQQKLAAALPAFRPYATMDAKDIDQCRDKRERSQVRDDIRNGIRESVRAVAGDRSPHRSEADEAADADSAPQPAAP